MNWFARLEKISGKLIEGIFKTKFAGPLQPVEIARALVKAMAEGRKVGISHNYIPNQFEVQVSQGDWEQIAAVQEVISQEILQFLQVKAREKNYQFIQHPEITFLPEASLKTGEMHIAAKFSEHLEEAVPPVVQPGQAAVENGEEVEHTQVFQLREQLRQEAPPLRLPGAEILVTQGNSQGMKFRLGKGVSTLGRRENNDIFLDDPNISRLHARIERSPEGYLVIDMGSLNGTYLNGQRINQGVLATGDKLKVGTTELEFRVV